MRLAAYAGTSVVLAAGVILRALHERANFYSAAVYLAQSNACLWILSNLVFLALGSILVGLQRLLYGPLRPIEIEQLYERTWISLTETCLAMTIFREEVGFWFIVLFTSLLIGKVWGWISEGRVDILEQQPPANPRLFHTRLSTSLALSFFFDLYMLYYTVSTVRAQARPNMMVMFAFEFAVLSTVSLSTCARYALSLQEQSIIQRQTAQKLREQRERILREREEANREAEQNGEEGPTFPQIEDELNEFEVDVPGWEDKGRWMFYLNIVTDFLKLVLYMTFFCVLCMFYGMPIHIIRDVAYTVQSFYKRITDFVKYRHATRDMNERYPDATAEQIGREETCIICREIMREWQPNAEPPMEERLRPKKLPCGHVLHLACLRSWLERQQNCPTCRQNVLEDTDPRTSTQGNRTGVDQGAGDNNERPPAGGGDGGDDGGAGAGGAQQNRNRDQARRRNRMRFLNLGPLRVGFGAGNMADLQREINQQAANHGNRPGGRAPSNPIRRAFGLPDPPQNQRNSASISAQLSSIEQQLLNEMNVNMLQQEQLRVVRAMQGELARLRIRQAQSARGEGGGAPLPASLQQGQTATSLSPGAMLPGMQGYTSTQQPQILGPGHPDLPAGVTFPEGWQLVPLERIPPGYGSQNTFSATTRENSASSPLPVPGIARQEAEESDGRQNTETTSNVASGVISVDSHNPLTSSSHGTTNEALTQVTATPSEELTGAAAGAALPTSTPQPHSTDASSSLPNWSFTSPSEPSSSSELQGDTSSTAAGDKGKGRAPAVEDASDEDLA